MINPISFKKTLANFIDIFIALTFRFIVIQTIFIVYKDKIQASAIDFNASVFDKIKENNNFVQTEEFYEIVSNHSFPKILITFLLIFFFSGSLYYIYFNSSKWCATIGQRIMKLVLVNEDDSYIGFSKSLAHYFISIIPFLIIFYFILNILANANSAESLNFSFLTSILTKNIFNIFLIITMIVIFNISLFSKSKKTASDIICKTKICEGKTDKKYPF